MSTIQLFAETEVSQVITIAIILVVLVVALVALVVFARYFGCGIQSGYDGAGIGNF